MSLGLRLRENLLLIPRLHKAVNKKSTIRNTDRSALPQTCSHLHLYQTLIRSLKLKLNV